MHRCLSFGRVAMNEPAQTSLDEPRWPPALAILVVFALLAVLPHHVQLAPAWVRYIVVLAVLVPMLVVKLTKANAFWLLVERRLIMLFAAAYIVNTTAELADMIGIITLHPPETRQISLLSSSLAIWVTNVLTFSLVYWQIDARRAVRPGSRDEREAGLALSAGIGARRRGVGLATDVPRLSVSWIQHRDGVQSYRRRAAHATGQDANDA